MFSSEKSIITFNCVYTYKFTCGKLIRKISREKEGAAYNDMNYQINPKLEPCEVNKTKLIMPCVPMLKKLGSEIRTIKSGRIGQNQIKETFSV